MKKITKSIIAVLGVSTMLTASLPFSASAADGTIKPRGSYYVYGDVNNDGHVNASDASCVLIASKTFSDLTGSSDLPLEYAIARPSIYFKNLDNPVPQAADTNGDGIINQADADDILEYSACVGAGSLSKYKGKCGKPFYIN